MFKCQMYKHCCTCINIVINLLYLLLLQGAVVISLPNTGSTHRVLMLLNRATQCGMNNKNNYKKQNNKSKIRREIEFLDAY